MQSAKHRSAQGAPGQENCRQAAHRHEQIGKGRTHAKPKQKLTVGGADLLRRLGRSQEGLGVDPGVLQAQQGPRRQATEARGPRICGIRRIPGQPGDGLEEHPGPVGQVQALERIGIAGVVEAESSGEALGGQPEVGEAEVGCRGGVGGQRGEAVV